jgi:hypothetical protein
MSQGQRTTHCVVRKSPLRNVREKKWKLTQIRHVGWAQSGDCAQGQSREGSDVVSADTATILVS